jgi:RNA polymerase sigma-70 factor (ECF subfamily)
MAEKDDAFRVQGDVRRPWRDYLDSLAALRPALHRYCVRLTGNVWDGEDLVQDTLVRVFSLLGKIDADLENPRAYLIRTATNLWIDRMRRVAREQAVLELERAQETSVEPGDDARPAARALFTDLHPQERAAVVMKEVFDLSLDETASLLHTSVGAIKSALNRARGRLSSKRKAAGFDAPPREVVEKFLHALRAKDIEGLRALCKADLTVELVGGAEMEGFERSRMFFEHAHMVLPIPGFGTNPRWELAMYEGEPVVIGWRTLDGAEGLNEIHRIEASAGKVTRVRSYCFAPDVLQTVADDLGLKALPRPYRSPG